MNQSLEVTNIKNEPIDSISNEQQEILTEMHLKSVKQGCDSLILSKIHIKTEPQENENKFPVIAGTPYDLCLNYDMKIETEEPLIKIECEDLLNELMQDPLDVDSKIKVEEHFPVDMDQVESGIKTKPTEGDKNKNHLEIDEDDESQNQLLIRNDTDCKDKKCICGVCNKIFTQKGSLNRHLRIHTGARSFICDVCEKSFTQKSNLDTHMLIHSGKKTHICDVCSKVFTQKSSLNLHKLIHSGKKSFSCSECDKAFTQKQVLVVHKRLHSGEKPFTCNICDKAFTNKSHLTEHRRLHTGEKPYSCDICKKSFTQKSTLNGHKKTHNN